MTQSSIDACRVGLGMWTY